MREAYIVMGALADNQTVALDEPLPTASGKVRVMVEILTIDPKPELHSFMERMWTEQGKRGHVPRTQEQVLADLKTERESWN